MCRCLKRERIGLCSGDGEERSLTSFRHTGLEIGSTVGQRHAFSYELADRKDTQKSISKHPPVETVNGLSDL